MWNHNFYICYLLAIFTPASKLLSLSLISVETNQLEVVRQSSTVLECYDLLFTVNCQDIMKPTGLTASFKFLLKALFILHVVFYLPQQCQLP